MMTSGTAEDLNVGTRESLRNELTRTAPQDLDRVRRTPAPAPAAEASPEPVARLPRRIAGGFRAVGDELDRRSRDWKNMVRLLEQQRPQLESAEAERDRLYEILARVGPEVQESGRTLKAMLDTTKSGDVSGDLTAQFTKSLNALEELENVAGALTANLLWIRSAWEQYARSIIRAQKMREELKLDASER